MGDPVEVADGPEEGAARDERLARERLTNLERAWRVQAARRRSEAKERRQRERARIRELKDDEAELSREYSTALREATRLPLRATQERFDEAWSRVESLGSRMRSVIASRKQMEQRVKRDDEGGKRWARPPLW